MWGKAVGPLTERLHVQIPLHPHCLLWLRVDAAMWSVGPVGADWLPLICLFAIYYNIQIIYISKRVFKQPVIYDFELERCQFPWTAGAPVTTRTSAPLILWIIEWLCVSKVFIRLSSTLLYFNTAASFFLCALLSLPLFSRSRYVHHSSGALPAPTCPYPPRAPQIFVKQLIRIVDGFSPGTEKLERI